MSHGNAASLPEKAGDAFGNRACESIGQALQLRLWCCIHGFRVKARTDFNKSQSMNHTEVTCDAHIVAKLSQAPHKQWLDMAIANSGYLSRYLSLKPQAFRVLFEICL